MSEKPQVPPRHLTDPPASGTPGTPGAPGGPRRGPLRITVPSRNDPLLRRLTEVIGGPLGRFTAPGRVDPGFWTVERVLVALTVVAAIVAVLAKNMCRTLGWGGSNAYIWACYSDWSALFHARGFDANAFAPFADGAQFEYPVLMSAVASFAAMLVVPGDYNRTLAFFDVNLLLVVLLWFVIVIAAARSAGRRPWDAAMVALAPGIILASTINWDMWAVMFLALAVLAFARNRPVLAGILIGLGASMKVYPILFLGVVLVLALRTGRWRPLLQVATGTAGAWLVVNLPFMITNYASWSYFLDFTRDRGAGLSSLWHAWNLTAGVLPGAPEFTPEAINAAAFWLFAASCAGICVLGLLARRRPRVASLLFLVVGAFVLFNKVYSPQFVVWLVPLAALAWPRWRDFLIWQLVEALHFWAIWMYLYSGSTDVKAQNTFPEAFYVIAVAGHMIATGYLMYKVARSIWDEDTDPVRRVGQDDPQAGPYAGTERDPLPRWGWIGRPVRAPGQRQRHPGADIDRTVEPPSSTAP
ncbi:glycosyltransferase family 87 protein [Arthrobacter sp.]|uniref:glycosyltransferase family 87 protein n=1 Tax=Arthrobacter sp. TaxID=1667 RepID=UPI003A95042D